MEILPARRGRLRFDLRGQNAVKVNSPFDSAGEIRALIEGKPTSWGESVSIVGRSSFRVLRPELPFFEGHTGFVTKFGQKLTLPTRIT